MQLSSPCTCATARVSISTPALLMLYAVKIPADAVVLQDATELIFTVDSRWEVAERSNDTVLGGFSAKQLKHKEINAVLTNDSTASFFEYWYRRCNALLRTN